MKHILCFGSYERSQAYSRNESIILAFKSAGITLTECNALTDKDKLSKKGIFKSRSGIARYVKQIPRILLTALICQKQIRDCDAVYIPYPSHLSLLLLFPILRLYNKPVIIDVFISIYDTLVEDRQLFKNHGMIAKFIFRMEALTLSIPQIIFIDTPENAELLINTYSISDSRIIDIPVGIDESVWKPHKLESVNDEFIVAFWSTFIPLHGAEIVAEAAGLLAENYKKVKFKVIGDGQTAERFRSALKQFGANNVYWDRRLASIDDLAELAESAHCCLGVFGTTAKAGRVIPYKIYQALASARPIITANTPASRRLFRQDVDAILVSVGSPEELANAIIKMMNNENHRILLARNGRNVYEKELSQDVIRERIANISKI